MKYKLILAGICISIIIASWWMYKSPQKDVSTKIQWSIDEATGKEVPLFQLHYKWDGVEENDPTWLIFPREEKWWVVDLRDVMRLYSEVKSESDLRDNIRKYRENFTYSWIENRKFEPKASRYEAVMTALGFNMLFSTERHAFFDILEGTKDFNEGRLYPEEPKLSEEEHQKYSSLANKSVHEFNTFLDKRCEQHSNSIERERCLVNASKEWLNTYGKKYEEIPSRYISGNDLAIGFIENASTTP